MWGETRCLISVHASQTRWLTTTAFAMATRRRNAGAGEREPVHGNGIEWAEHVADVLLSLPGIAIVELPPETITPTGWGDDCLGAWPAAPGEDPVSAWPKGKIAMSGGDFISVPDAHALAAALLAAAQAAEKSTTQQ